VRRLAELNDAYGAIAHRDDAAAQRELEASRKGAKNGHARRSRLLTRRRAPVTNVVRRTLYEQLHVAPHADTEVIRLAAAMMLQEPARTKEEIERREAIERAREVLCDPEQRAAYDEKHGIARPPATFAPAPPSDTTGSMPTAQTKVAPTPADSSAAEAAIEALAASVALPIEPPAPREEAPAEAQGAIEEPGAPVEPEAGQDLEQAAARNGDAYDEEGAGSRASVLRRWNLPPLFRRDDGDLTEAVEEAETQRVLALREELASDSANALGATDAFEAAVDGHGDAQAALDEQPSGQEDEPDETGEDAAHAIEPDAVLRFTSGPRKGARIAITRDAIVLGATPSADVMLPLRHGPGGVPRIRIWRQADSYLLQQDEGPLVLIGGRPIDMPIVVLDDGDEISIGDNTVRFERLSVDAEADPRVIRMPSAG